MVDCVCLLQQTHLRYEALVGRLRPSSDVSGADSSAFVFSDIDDEARRPFSSRTLIVDNEYDVSDLKIGPFQQPFFPFDEGGRILAYPSLPEAVDYGLRSPPMPSRDYLTVVEDVRRMIRICPSKEEIVGG